MKKCSWKKAASLCVVPCVALSLAVFASACDNKNEKVAAAQTSDVVAKKFDQVTKISGKTFGTFYYVTVPGGYPGGEDTLRSDAEFVFKKVSDAISTFDQNAEIARFNAYESTKDFVISGYLADVLEQVQRQSLRIEHSMDPTVGPLVNLWGFGPNGEVHQSPSQAEIDETLAYVGIDKITLRRVGSGGVLQKLDPRVKLDLSTIGEGLAADELAQLLDEKGINNYMIAIAGAIRSKGANPDGKLWRVGIEDPVSQGQKVFAAVCPQGMAISTAGSYRNFFIDEKTGTFYSHIIDPKTGYPINHRTVSVSVIARSALETDALDTGLLVQGAKAAVEWGNKTETPVYAIEVDEQGKEVATYSRAFTPYLKCVLNLSISPVPQDK